jgi:protein-S-isoprenylcysteine O-methyltransferase Ste14
MSMLLLVQFLLCPLVLLALLRVTAPYGRHRRPGWGPELSSRAAWFVMELPALLVLPLLVLASPARAEPAAWLPMVLWLVHYAYRTLLFPALMRPGGNAFPLLLVACAIGFNLLNGYNNGGALIANAYAGASPLAPHVIIGVLAFAAGFLMHCQADHTIRALRGTGDHGYRVPQGGLFRWVGSPHYLGEIIQWSGWAILTWSLAGLAFALFTICNLLPRAIANDRWYRQQFPDYPQHRRVLFPGIF